MICHQERMSNIKPVVRIEAPKHCFEGGTRKTPRPSSAGVARGEFGEVREAFKRILSARPAVDTSTPRGSAEMAQRLSRNRTLGAKQQRYVAEQHERNMKHMARRIANSGSLTERKKNKLDPTLYPPWLLRRVDGGPATAATAESLWRNELLKRTASASSVSAGGVSARLAGGRPSSAPNLARARAARPSTAPAAPAARPAVDTSTPRGSAEMAQRLSRNRTLGAKQQRYVAEQHERNMKHMARRIANSGSLTEHKKNKLDPTLYPPWLLRRVDGGPATAATAETLWRNELLKLSLIHI